MKRFRVSLYVMLILILLTAGFVHRISAEEKSPAGISGETGASPQPENGDETGTKVIVPEITPLDRPVDGQSPAPDASPAKKEPKPIPPLSPEEEKIRAANRAELAKQIDGFVKSDPAWQQARVGIYVETVLRGDEIYRMNGNLPMIPASNLKVVTSAAGLSLMGPEYQFETSVWGGEIGPDGIIKGNLYLKGTGDPTFMEPFCNNSSEVFHKFAQSLVKKGIKAVEGDLVGDDSAFDREFLGRGWKPRYLLEEYAAPAGALSINANCIRLIIQKGSVSMLPGNKYIQLIYNASSQGDIRATRKLGTDIVTVAGFSAGTVYRNLTINNPSDYTTAVFREVLSVNGIQVKGKTRLINAQDENYRDNTRQLVFYKSVPLRKIVREINKESDNVCAQHVFKALGYHMKGRGTCDNSNEAIREWMKSEGIDSSGFAMADGSGLSVYNRITPRQICDILRAMVNSSHWNYFWESLPIAGKDGTLIYRMHGLPVRAKTGGLQGHIALSGYVTTKGGQMVVFSILTNAHKHWGDRIRQNEDELVKIIASFDKAL